MMRATGASIFLFALATMLLGGCLDSAPGADGDDEDGPRSGSDEERPCHERDRPVADPEEQEVESRDDLLCWGHYVVENDGDDPTDAVPRWGVDDWWHYRGDITETPGNIHCGEYRHSVTGTKTHHNTSVYTTQVAQYRCQGDPIQNATRERYYTEHSLTWLMHDARSDGFIRHDLLFPLAEGKAWAYMDNDGTIVEAEAHHLDDHEFGDEELEAWRVDLSGTNRDGNDWTKQIWFSIDARNIIEEKFSLEGVQYYHWWLVDSIDGHGKGDGIL